MSKANSWMGAMVGSIIGLIVAGLLNGFFDNRLLLKHSLLVQLNMIFIGAFIGGITGKMMDRRGKYLGLVVYNGFLGGVVGWFCAVSFWWAILLIIALAIVNFVYGIILGPIVLILDILLHYFESFIATFPIFIIPISAIIGYIIGDPFGNWIENKRHLAEEESVREEERRLAKLREQKRQVEERRRQVEEERLRKEKMKKEILNRIEEVTYR